MNEEEINDRIDEWRAGDTGVLLHTYLGMSPEEYHIFCMSPEIYFDQRLFNKWANEYIEKYVEENINL